MQIGQEGVRLRKGIDPELDEGCLAYGMGGVPQHLRAGERHADAAGAFAQRLWRDGAVR